MSAGQVSTHDEAGASASTSNFTSLRLHPHAESYATTRQCPMMCWVPAPERTRSGRGRPEEFPAGGAGRINPFPATFTVWPVAKFTWFKVTTLPPPLAQVVDPLNT